MIRLTYETKCRRCGHINSYVFASVDGTDEKETQYFYNLLRKYIDEKLTDPILHKCNGCFKLTVQDMISMSEPPT